MKSEVLELRLQNNRITSMKKCNQSLEYLRATSHPVTDCWRRSDCFLLFTHQGHECDGLFVILINSLNCSFFRLEWFHSTYLTSENHWIHKLFWIVCKPHRVKKYIYRLKYIHAVNLINIWLNIELKH